MAQYNIKKVKEREFEIVELLSKEYSVKSLCLVLNISKSGYYKRVKFKDKLNQHEINRINLSEYVLK